MDIILIAGLWLPRSVWNDVNEELTRLGHRPLPVSLPGADDGSTTATLDDQLAAVLAAIDTAEQPLLVGHSAACTVAWMAADRRPDAVRSVVMIGGFPGSNGSTYADFLPIVDGAMPFPGWEPFEGPDAADLDDITRARVESVTVAVPERVAMGVVQLNDDRRFDLPLVLVCPEYSPDQARRWIESGDVPELADAANIAYIDIDSGHWPMVTRPAELAQLLDGIAVGL